MNKKYFIIFLTVIMVALFLRFYKLSSIPPGTYIDEASYGYNAYSILKTGKDEWGKAFPIFLRSFGTYPSPMYMYLLIIPVKFLGLSNFSIRLPTALAGVFMVIITFFLIYYSKKPHPVKLALISSALLALAPWSIIYSRLAIENNLALFILLIGFLISLFIKEKTWLFIPVSVLFAISAYAYAAERVMGVILLVGIIYLLKNVLFKNKKILILGIIIFIIIQLPQFLLLNTGGAKRRYTQQSFLSHEFYVTNGKYQNVVFGEQIYYVREFVSQYSAYFSPRNLFFNPDSQLSRSVPDLSVFYPWMMIPFFFGIVVLWKNRKQFLSRLLIFVIITSPIPAAVTRDPFYTSRVLPLLWAFSLVIGLGVIDILERLSKPVKIIIIFLAVSLSFYSLYSSYFVLLPHERSSEFGYQYQELSRILDGYKNQHVVINTEVEYPTYIILAFYTEYDPQKMQIQSAPRLVNGYYNQMNFDEKYVLDNIEIRPIFWDEDIYHEQILVGSPIAISDQQAEEHYLKLTFEIEDLSGNIALRGFLTDPVKKCMPQPGKEVNSHCIQLKLPPN